MDNEKIRQVVRKLMATDRMHRNVVDQRIRSMGMHRSQHMMLMHLSRQQQTPSQVELCRMFDISAPAVAGILKNLEKNGYICRHASKTDARVNEISITDKGREIVARTRTTFEEVDRLMMNQISEEQADALCATLDQLQKNLEACD